MKRSILNLLLILVVLFGVFSIPGAVRSTSLFPEDFQGNSANLDDPPTLSTQADDPVDTTTPNPTPPPPAEDIPEPIVDLDDPPELSAQASGPTAVAAGVPSLSSGFVLWDQYANWSTNNHAAQDFEAGMDSYDIYAADDFENTMAWEIDTITIRGGWTDFVDISVATSIQWWICPDNGGEPLCDPPNDGSAVWSISLPPANPQVHLGYHQPEDVILTLDTPVILPPGHWWLAYQVSLDYSTYGQYGWSGTYDPVWGAVAKQNNPNNGFGMGTGWWNNNGGEDYMFRLEGSLYLWDQYANYSGSNFAAQDFDPAYDQYDIYAADDFENTVTWEIDTIITRGGWTSFVDLNNANGGSAPTGAASHSATHRTTAAHSGAPRSRLPIPRSSLVNLKLRMLS